MTDHLLDPEHILILGMTGSGKTTFAICAMLNLPGVACRFVFDWNERIVPRLPIRACYTLDELEDALPTRWVVFHPRLMFPGSMFDKKAGAAALRWFCSWVRAASKRGPGKKLFACAELWNFCTEDAIPPELAMLADDGRQDNVSFMFDTQHPQKLNASIVGAATELVCFKLLSDDALREVRRMDVDPDLVKSLAPGEFVSFDRLRPGCMIRGRVF
jgi:hypothetical protein